MLNPNRLKTLLNDPKLSDQEIADISHDLQVLAEITLEQWRYERDQIRAAEDTKQVDKKF